MRYILKITSNEEQDFKILVQIDAQATFFDLHKLLLDVCNYDGSQMASFFTVDAKGQRLQEIGLMELSSEGEEVNVAVMDVAILQEFVNENVARLEYTYDFFGDRYFSIEIEEMQKGAQEQAVVLQKEGVVPPQIELDGFEDLDFAPTPKTTDKEEIDYEKYLSEFDDCGNDGIDYQSLDDLEEDFI